MKKIYKKSINNYIKNINIKTVIIVLLSLIAISMIINKNKIKTDIQIQKNLSRGDIALQEIEEKVEVYKNYCELNKINLSLYDFWDFYNGDKESQYYEDKILILLYDDNLKTIQKKPIYYETEYSCMKNYKTAAVIYNGFEIFINDDFTVSHDIKDLSNLEDDKSTVKDEDLEPVEESTRYNVKGEENLDLEFEKLYAKVDIIWLVKYEGEDRVSCKPSYPNYSNLIPISYNEYGKEILYSTKYNYLGLDKSNNSCTDKSQWANAKTVEGSYFVWIPKFAYRIEYYKTREDSFNSNVMPEAIYDGFGLYKINDDETFTLKQKADENIKSIIYDKNKYIIQPAFTTDINNGGWDEELDGFWISKYEMCTSAKEKIISCEQEEAIYNATFSDAYWKSFYFDRENESHLIKSSEWGAVCLLTHSCYGKNGTEVDMSDTISSIVGIYDEDKSTTGNRYGIYGFAGGVSEFTSCYVEQGDKNLLDTFASYLYNNGSTKYITKYNEEESITGDGIYEMSLDNKVSVYPNNDKIQLPNHNYPFMQRGKLHYDYIYDIGIFSICNSDGGNNEDSGFRLVLTTKNNNKF